MSKDGLIIFSICNNSAYEVMDAIDLDYSIVGFELGYQRLLAGDRRRARLTPTRRWTGSAQSFTSGKSRPRAIDFAPDRGPKVASVGNGPKAEGPAMIDRKICALFGAGGARGAGGLRERRRARRRKASLSAAGFVRLQADTPARVAKLQALPQNTIVFAQRKSGPVYIYADAAGCNCAFVGSPAAYQQYQQIRRRQQHRADAGDDGRAQHGGGRGLGRRLGADGARLVLLRTRDCTRRRLFGQRRGHDHRIIARAAVAALFAAPSRARRRRGRSSAPWRSRRASRASSRRRRLRSPSSRRS